MQKTNISINDVQVAAFPYTYNGRPVTLIIKKTKAGHYFVNSYIRGVKALKSFYRESGRGLAGMLGMTLRQLNNKLFDSTLSVQWKKAKTARGEMQHV